VRPTAARLLTCTSLLVGLLSSTAFAQQRPLLTEDPESIGAGRILLEGGIDWLRSQEFPASGLEGHLVRLPTLGASIGLSSIAELQVDGAYQRLSITQRKDAPLADLLDVPDTKTSAWDDLVIATKIRFVPEGAGYPGLGVRLATKLPMASNATGLGLDTTDFYTTLLVGKTVRSVRVVGNVGFGILTDPTAGNRQNDVLIYGVSIARAVTNKAEFVGEINGRGDIGGSEVESPPGTEARSQFRFGTRFTQGTVRVDAAVIFGLTSRDPSIGFTSGVTYVFNAFRVP
jgi:hypothetical protein